MEPNIAVNFAPSLVMGLACALIASSKGRSGVGWFVCGALTGCIGLIIILCVSNLKEDRVRWERTQNRHRRLREQLRQERMKNDAFREEVSGRLDVHDDVLGLDTKRLSLPDLARLEAPRPGSGDGVPLLADADWFIYLGDKPSQGLALVRLRDLFQRGEINEDTLVWADPMDDWTPLADVPGLLEELS